MNKNRQKDQRNRRDNQKQISTLCRPGIEQVDRLRERKAGLVNRWD